MQLYVGIVLFVSSFMNGLLDDYEIPVARMNNIVFYSLSGATVRGIGLTNYVL